MYMQGCIGRAEFHRFDIIKIVPDPISRYCTVVRVIAMSAQTGACSWFIRPNNLSNHLATSNKLVL